jgi:hypothetical protein
MNVFVSIAKKRSAKMTFKAIGIFFAILLSIVFKYQTAFACYVNANVVPAGCYDASWPNNGGAYDIGSCSFNNLTGNFGVLNVGGTYIGIGQAPDGEFWGGCNVNNYPNWSNATTTRIVDFTPEDGFILATTSPDYPFVHFSLQVYINPQDVGTISGIKLTLHNIDENTLLLTGPADIYLFDGQATTTGNWYFSTSTPIGDGNYRIEATLERTYFGGFFENPLSPINQDESHLFIVGEETFIGHMTQSSWKELQRIYASTTATSTASLATSCNPLNFSTISCLSFLLVPDTASLNDSLKNLKDSFLVRIPWGYLTRLYNILTETASTTLPSYTVSIPFGAGSETASTTNLTFDPADMMAGGGAILDSVHDPIHNKTVKDIFYPIVQLVVALGVLLTIAADISGSHKHHHSRK